MVAHHTHPTHLLPYKERKTPQWACKNKLAHPPLEHRGDHVQEHVALQQVEQHGEGGGDGGGQRGRAALVLATVGGGGGGGGGTGLLAGSLGNLWDEN